MASTWIGRVARPLQLKDPHPRRALALDGIVVNILATWALTKANGESLNERGSFQEAAAVLGVRRASATKRSTAARFRAFGSGVAPSSRGSRRTGCSVPRAVLPATAWTP